MAPIGEAYFPPLDRCLNRSQQLWSWELCFSALSQLHVIEHESLKHFLSDSQAQEILYHPSSPYPKPTSTTKSSFETKTSAVNATPSSNGSYDVQEIRNDALWLSQQNAVDEVSCLRIAILEWQTRAASQLLQTGQTLKTSNQVSSPFTNSSLLDGKKQERIEQIMRRRRLSELMLSERTHILKCAEFIFARWVCQPKNDSHSREADLLWLEQISKGMSLRWSLAKGTSKGKEPARNVKKPIFILEAIDGVRSRLAALEVGSGWTGLEAEQAATEVNWGVCQAIEIVHLLELIHDVLLASSALPPAEIVLTWFRLMAECAFFEGFQLPYPGLEIAYSLPLQSLVSLISLSALNVTATLDLLADISSSGAIDQEQDPSLPYILNYEATRELNDILIAIAPLGGASPCVMAWSIISQAAKETALEIRETRDNRRSLHAAQRFDGGGDSSDTDGYDHPTTRSPSSRRRTSAGSDISQGQTLLEEIHDSISVTLLNEDPVTYLTENASEGNKVFDVIATLTTRYLLPYRFEHNGAMAQKVRAQMLDLLRACANYFEYQPGIVMAILIVISGSESYWDLVDKDSRLIASGLSKLLRTDDLLKRRILLVAISRFPYETLPVLELLRVLSYQEYETLMHERDTFTCLLPPEYTGYRNIREDETMNYVELTDDYAFDFYTSLTGAKRGDQTLRIGRGSSSIDNTLTIPAGTSGEVLSGGKPLVVAWNYTYSGVRYIGYILGCASTASISNLPANSPISIDNVAEAIGVLKTSLLSIVKQEPHNVEDLATPILAEASDALDRNDDVVSVILRIFENALYAPSKLTSAGELLPLLVECVQFTHVLLAIQPDRVWPFLGRSGLLDIGEEGGQLNAIISAIETVSGQYEFLFSCIRLFDALIEDVVDNAVRRKSVSKAIVRFGAVGGFGAGVSQQTMEKVLASLQRTMIDVLQTFADWKFVSQKDQTDMGFWLCNINGKMLRYTYATDTQTHSKLTESLSTPTRLLADALIADVEPARAIDPLLQIIKIGLESPSTSVPSHDITNSMQSVVSSLKLINSLLEHRAHFSKDTAQLRDYLFSQMPLLAALYGAKVQFRRPVAVLINTLVQSYADEESQPPSLLGHLGHDSSGQLLNLLSALDKPLTDTPLNAAVWQLLGSILSTRQQWFAHFILTGRPPSHRVKGDTQGSNVQSADAMLSKALDALSNINNLEFDNAISMLDFTISAVDFWPQTLQIIHDHPKFAKALPQFAITLDLEAESRAAATSSGVSKVNLFNRILDILAIYIHWTLQEGLPRFAEETLNHLYDLSANITVSPSYNHSLHANLRQNFNLKFAGCDLTDFQTTVPEAKADSGAISYDLLLADKMLSYEAAWRGRNGKGFRDEMQRASLNLALVDAQISSFRKWSSLLIELSSAVSKAEKYQTIIADMAVKCLEANIENTLPKTYSQEMVAARAELAFSLIQTLNTAKSNVKSIQSILPVAWKTLRSCDEDMGSALSSDNADYYRLLIRIIYLAIQLHTFPQAPPKEPTQTSFREILVKAPPIDLSIRVTLEVVSSVVGKGFRSLTSLLHESPSLVLPSDFSILIAILSLCFQIPGLTHNTEHLVRAFTDTQTPRCASALLSWSHQLAVATSGDPIYGELALQLLLELSTLPALAETLAVETVLSHIMDATLIQNIQDKAFGPFDNPPRMYLIWARGLLPLLLNLLSGVGPQIAAEVASALNTFPDQLSRASQGFSSAKSNSASIAPANNGFMTLAVAQEAHCLALITSIIRRFKEAGPSAGINPADIEDVQWNHDQVKEDIEGWLGRRAALRDRIVPTSEKEEQWSRMRPSKEGVADNILEEKVVEELKGVIGILGGST